MVILCLAVAFVMIYIFWTNTPSVVITKLYPEKSRLVRYMACSLAICTKGCDGSDPTVENICLENFTDTPECDIECKSACEYLSGGDLPGPGEACGRSYTLQLTIEGGGILGGAPLRGIYTRWFSLTAGCGSCTDAKDLMTYMKEGFFPRCGPPPLYIFLTMLPHSWIWTQTSIPCVGILCPITRSSAGAFPNLPEPSDIVSSAELYGGIFDTDSEACKHGSGKICLEPEVARATFGCYEESPFKDQLPLVGWSPSASFCGGDMGYYQCKFQGDLYIWSQLKDPDDTDKANVYINSTIPEPGYYTVDVTPTDVVVSETPEEVLYGIVIKNQLGTPKTFYIDFGYGVEPDIENICSFYVDDELKNSVWIDSEDEEIVELRCDIPEEPSGNLFKKNTIPISVWPAGEGRVEPNVYLTIIDFGIEVVPLDPDDFPNGDRATVGLGELANYNVTITNKFNEKQTFGLWNDTDDNVDCIDLPEFTDVDGYESKTIIMRCSSDDEGEYNIIVTAEHTTTGLKKDDSVRLRAARCRGNLHLGAPASVSSGTGFEIKASGFEGCDEEVIELRFIHSELGPDYYCTPDPPGEVCDFSFVAQSPGIYRVYGNMTISGEIKTNTTTITITNRADNPAKKEDRSGACWFNWISPQLGAYTICRDPNYKVTCECTQNYNGEEGYDHCCDPQDCWGTSISASNLCCSGLTLGGRDVYYPGPKCWGDGCVPCLSPDFYTGYPCDEVWPHNCGPYTYISQYAIQMSPDYCQSNDGCRRNILIKGDTNLPGFARGYVEFTQDNSYIQIDIRTGSIAEDLKPRPIHGVQVVALNYTTDESYAQTHEPVNFDLYLLDEDENEIYHEKKSVKVSDFTDYNFYAKLGYEQWVWDNVKRIRIEGEAGLLIDYIGLLSAEGVPYCSYGDAPTNRIVNDGTTCFWNLDCADFNKNGWDGEEDTTVGAVGECDCSSGTCGRGYCEYPLGNGKSICYHFVECAHGGWRIGGSDWTLEGVGKYHNTDLDWDCSGYEIVDTGTCGWKKTGGVC